MSDDTEPLSYVDRMLEKYPIPVTAGPLNVEEKNDGSATPITAGTAAADAARDLERGRSDQETGDEDRTA